MTRVVFAGTPAFAVESLRALLAAGVEPIAVVTQPDRPAGRGKKITASAVKQFSEERGLPIWQPDTLKSAESQQHLKDLNADLLIVVAYGQILPQLVLDLPRIGCINVHASVLPRWRGAAPIQAAILAGDATSGISLMRMEAGLDTGPVLASAELTIGKAETAGELHDRLARLGGELLVNKLESIVSGVLLPQAQDERCATYAEKIQSSAARIDWQQSAEDIDRSVRAYNPLPGAWTTLENRRLKVWKAEAVAGHAAKAGTVLAANAAGIDVACGTGALRVLELQRAGRKRVSAAEMAAQFDLIGQSLADE